MPAMLQTVARTAEDAMPPLPSSDQVPGRVIVTIDGPAGTGKSSAARDLAARLGLEMLNTGQMYRAATALAIDAGIDLSEDNEKDPATITAVCALAQQADLHFDWSQRPPVLLVSGRPMIDRLTEPDVRRLVSKVSSIPHLRRHMERKQRLIAAQHPLLVTEGRDQGSVVFPDADVKFFLEATPREQAVRRARELEAKGEVVDLLTLEEEIRQRNFFDSTRPDSPLVCASDAVVIDTDPLTLEQVVDRLERIVRERVPHLKSSHAAHPPHSNPPGA